MVLTALEDVRALLRQAKSIAYSADGAGAATFLDVISRIRVADEIMSRTRPMAPGQPVMAVALGRVELAVAPLTSIVAAPGIEVTALFPSNLHGDINLSMFLSTNPGNRALAQDLIAFLADTGLDAHLASKGVFRFRLP